MNPVRKILDEFELQIGDLAALMGTDTTQVYRLLRGNAARVPASFFKSMKDLQIDVDAEEFEADYQAFREEMRKEIIERVTG